MKKVSLALFVSCLFASAVADNPVLRIMPLGDSITEGAGATSTGGYRGPLWTLLANAGYNVDYVGSNTTNQDKTNGMDPDHEGHGGWRLDGTSGGNGIFEKLPTWFSTIESPDVILLHLGTNDSGADTLNTMSRTTALLDRLFALQPSAHVVVTTIMWRNDAARYARIQTYNSNLTNVVQQQAAKGQKISILDMHAAVPGDNRLEEGQTTFFGDGLHPNVAGYSLMANAWFGAIQELYPDPADFTTTHAPAPSWRPETAPRAPRSPCASTPPSRRPPPRTSRTTRFRAARSPPPRSTSPATAAPSRSRSPPRAPTVPTR